MIVRLTSFNSLPNKIEDLKKMYNDEITPIVKQQKGNLDCKLLEPVDKSDDYISMTVWDNKEDADAYQTTGIYKKLVDKAKPFFSTEPTLKTYKAEEVMKHA